MDKNLSLDRGERLFKGSEAKPKPPKHPTLTRKAECLGDPGKPVRRNESQRVMVKIPV